MGRRTKEELTQANYYEWLKVCEDLRARKKNGEKLNSSQKAFLRSVPTPESPYVPSGEGATPVKKKVKATKVKIDFDKTVVWPIKAQAFLCGVYNIPYGDEQCMLFCERDDCPFHGVGYFRSHGIKF